MKNITTVRSSRIPLITAALIVALLNGGCASLAVTALGIGGTAGVTHAMNGVVYRTFTAPIGKVRLASIQALKRMGIGVGGSEKQKDGELIRATAPDREIEIELEVVSANTTRMRSVAKKGSFLYDNATATEIVQQTERSLNPVRGVSSQTTLVSKI
ncbi:MAG TPA: DUF3568 family protein [Burkholderiales bacterium]|nr:DUF3568 family protein [Burkholderiales bacterium]